MPYSLADVPLSIFTESTIREIFRVMDSAKTDPLFQKLSTSILNARLHGQWKDYRREAEVLLDWYRAHVDYRRDPVGVELIQSPWVTLEKRAGDCDDAVATLGALLETVGIPIRLVTISTRPDLEMSHIYIEFNVDGQWIPMDAIVQDAAVGWAPPHYTAKRTWSRSDVGLSGLGGFGMFDEEDWTQDGVFSGGRNGKNGAYEGGFSSGMRITNPTDVPDDISHTWAHPTPGEVMLSQRQGYTQDIAEFADERNPAYPGGEIRPDWPIEPHLTPHELFRVINRREVPLNLDPNQLVPTPPFTRPEEQYMYPQPLVNGDQSMSELAGYTELDGVGIYGVGGMSGFQLDPAALSAILNVAHGVVTTGQVPPAAIDNAFQVALTQWSAQQAQKLSAQQQKEALKQIQAQAQAAQIVPGYRAPSDSGLPGWVIPVGIGIALLGVGYAISR